MSVLSPIRGLEAGGMRKEEVVGALVLSGLAANNPVDAGFAASVGDG